MSIAPFFFGAVATLAAQGIIMFFAVAIAVVVATAKRSGDNHHPSKSDER